MSQRPSSRPSNSQSRFSTIPRADIQRSKFDRSHGLKTNFNAGDLVPIFVDEALPGDTFSLNPTTFARLATPIHPVMDNLYIDTFFFAVPIRLIWANWEKFNGEQTNPGASTDFLTPEVVYDTGGCMEGSLGDFFGIPTDWPQTAVSAFWHRAYNLIYNEWFRDQNLQSAALITVDDGPDDPNDYPIRKRGKRHDYFTSCLPFPQKGEDVGLTFGGLAPVIPDISDPGISDVPTFVGANDGGSVHELAMDAGAPSSDRNVTLIGGGDAGDAGPLQFTSSGLVSDLSNSTAQTINEIRRAFQIQRLYERDARGGSRYTEILRSHFGVSSPDQRLQRPEYLGGGTQTVIINPIAATSEAQSLKIGDLGGVGISSKTGGGFTKSFTEHCIVIGLISARADLTYQQGINRMWTRRTRWDYYWPALAHLGEQAVLQNEIFHSGGQAAGIIENEKVFGYQERYAEYRYKPSMTTNQMRSLSTTPLDTWHLAQDFAEAPVLNAAFIEEAPPVERILAVPSEPHFLLDCYFQFNCARPMPTYSVPGMIDHF